MPPPPNQATWGMPASVPIHQLAGSLHVLWNIPTGALNTVYSMLGVYFLVCLCLSSPTSYQVSSQFCFYQLNSLGNLINYFLKWWKISAIKRGKCFCKNSSECFARTQIKVSHAQCKMKDIQKRLNWYGDMGKRTVERRNKTHEKCRRILDSNWLCKCLQFLIPH